MRPTSLDDKAALKTCNSFAWMEMFIGYHILIPCIANTITDVVFYAYYYNLSNQPIRGSPHLICCVFRPDKFMFVKQVYT